VVGGLTVADGVLKIVKVGDITGDFFVPSYQRGYRWGELEVNQLLDDTTSRMLRCETQTHGC